MEQKTTWKISQNTHLIMKASKIFNDKNVKRDFEINLGMPKTTVEDSIVF